MKSPSSHRPPPPQKAFLVRDFDFPIPDGGEFELIVRALFRRLNKDDSYWKRINKLHWQTWAAFEGIASMSQQVPTVFSDEHANRCLAFAYLGYTGKLKREVVNSLLGGWRGGLRCRYLELSDFMMPFDSDDRKKTVESLFSIGSLLLKKDLSGALSALDNHLKQTRWLLGKKARVKIPNRTITHELPTPDHVLRSIDSRLESVKKKTGRLIDALSKREKEKIRLQSKLTTQIYIQMNAKWWIEQVPSFDRATIGAMTNLWLASDILFHEALHSTYQRIFDGGRSTKGFDRNVVWVLGQRATIGVIAECTAELKAVLKSVTELDPIGFEDAMTRHLLNSVDRSQLELKAG